MPRGFGGRGFGMRRVGGPIIMPGIMGGFGSPLLTSLMAGGLGYVIGSNAAQQSTPAQQPVIVPMYPPYQNPQTPTYSPENVKLAQLQLLDELLDTGVLNAEEVERQKKRILGE